ncbi:MAG: hypothetical protein ABIR24_14020 [Verrucomicrobiota bacterium]
MKFVIALFGNLLLSNALLSQTIELPPRPASGMTGLKFVEAIVFLDLQPREEKVFSEITNGNIPEFLRKLCPVTVTNIANGKTNTATYFVASDYLAVGSDEDYFLTPLTPFTAQKIADALGCTLPTRKMVNDIYSNAIVKLPPSPIPPTPAMITVPIFKQHHDTVRQQRLALLKKFPLGALTAGDKKDLVITSRLTNSPNKVAIYGWHQTNGVPIQPLYLGHTANWADYSHGIRLVQKKMLVNGVSKTVAEVLADPELAGLLSDEGIVSQAKYIFSEFPKVASHLSAIITASTNKIVLGQFQKSSFNEQTMWLQLDHGVRILINAPNAESFTAPKKMKLVFYGLPNGNTIEHTVGKITATNEDWHFNIQHIAAQTRFLREQLTDENIVVAYLENSLKTWPAWRKQFGDKAVLEIVEKVSNRFEGFAPKIILAGHSGGGSFTFGYLNCVEKIPDDIERIAFLDSNYGYETALHRDKFVNWLKSSDKHFLTVLAYHDDIALLNGKTFVSAAGGTWGKSHLMKKDFEPLFQFKETDISPDLKNCSALNGRLQFLMKENPDKKIFHTVQVEKNGFIHAMLTGTPLENKGYEYFGDRVYTKWISPE